MKVSLAVGKQIEQIIGLQPEFVVEKLFGVFPGVNAKGGFAKLLFNFFLGKTVALHQHSHEFIWRLSHRLNSEKTDKDGWEVQKGKAKGNAKD